MNSLSWSGGVGICYGLVCLEIERRCCGRRVFEGRKTDVVEGNVGTDADPGSSGALRQSRPCPPPSFTSSPTNTCYHGLIGRNALYTSCKITSGPISPPSTQDIIINVDLTPLPVSDVPTADSSPDLSPGARSQPERYQSPMYVLPHTLLLTGNQRNDTIEHADYDLVRLHHPDSPSCRHLTASQRHARFQSITAAYDTLRGRRTTVSPWPGQDEMEVEIARRRAYQQYRRRSRPPSDFDLDGNGREWVASADDRMKDRLILIIAGVVSIPFYPFTRG